MPAAATSIVTDRGVILIPVSIADRPRATERKSGSTKKTPIITMNWNRNIRSPPFRPRSISDGLNSGSFPASSTRRMCDPNHRSSRSPATMSQTTGDMPTIDGASSDGRNQPHSPDFSTPNTIRPIPTAHNTEPSASSRGRASTGTSATRRENRKMPAPTRTSPANTQRHDAYVVANPPIKGPTAIAIAPAAPTRP
jgi:hypothetical protein